MSLSDWLPQRFPFSLPSLRCDWNDLLVPSAQNWACSIQLVVEISQKATPREHRRVGRAIASG